MSLANTLRHPIESLRTAPVQLACMAVDAGAVAYTVHGGYVDNELLSKVQIENIAFFSGHFVLSALLAIKNFRLRNRLEDFIETYGFDERALATTTTTWCTRQAARVACEGFGVLEQYEELCEEREDSMQDKWLPHV